VSVTVRFTVLGGLHARRDGEELDLGSRQPQLMIAMLLARAGQQVSVSELTALLWGDDPPANAMNIVHRHVGAIRRAFQPGLAPRAEGERLARRPGGYRLAVEAGEVDLLRSRELAGHADAELRAGRRDAAVAAYREALRLWRGRFGEGLGAETHPLFVAVNRERTLTARAAVDAALGHPDAVSLLPAVQAAATADPFDEALGARLLLLLAAGGRPAEAIGHYRQFRERLADDLGASPGPELTAAFETVLREPRSAGTVAVPAPVVTPAPAQLPFCSTQFVGRQAEMAALDRMLEESAGHRRGVIAVDGLAGVGKTAVAGHWARRMAHRFPDGQLFLGLRGSGEGEPMPTIEALAQLLCSIGAAQQDLPATVEARAALLRTLTAGRSLLIVLDDVRDAEQVRPLIPASPGSLVIATGRGRLTGLAATNGAGLLTLDVPPPADARTQLLNRLGSMPPPQDPSEEAALAAILAHAGRLPLALSILGARMSAYAPVSLRDVADELRRSPGLDAFVGDAASDLRAAFARSHRWLSPAAAGLFAELSRTEGDIDPDIAAGLTGGTRAEVTATLSELVGAGLLSRLGVERYAVHNLIRAYAAERRAADSRPRLVRVNQCSGRTRPAQHALGHP